MAISPYLTFNSQCEAAFKFYEQAFGGKIEMMMRNEQAPPDSGMPVRPERAKYIMHAQMSIDGQTLMGADMLPDSYQKPHGITVAITVAVIVVILIVSIAIYFCPYSVGNDQVKVTISIT